MKNTFKQILLIIAVLLGAVLLTLWFYPQHAVRQPQKLDARWSKLNLILQQIEANYVDSVAPAQLTEKVLPELLRHLDPHSIYLPPRELKTANEELDGQFEGVGITFNMMDDTVRVITVIAGGPSARAGLQAGDRIIKVDTQLIAGRKTPQDSVVRLLRGPAGSKVTLGVERVGNPGLMDFAITRDRISDKSIDVAYMVDDSIGYVKLTKFSRTSYEEFLTAMSGLLKQGMTRLIFDIRGNTGGYLDQGLRIANEFLRKGQLVVYTQGVHRRRSDFHVPKMGFFCTQPMVLLIDEGSASSSEILAGALQDNDRGIIMGRRSFGKGLVQEPIMFSDNSGIRLTVGRFYTPTGRSIQKPYNGDNAEEYEAEVYARYLHGEFMQADSIPRNDSLKYVTPKGKVVYGGGGIIPDIFIPLDTTGTNELYVTLNRRSATIRFSNLFADKHRAALNACRSLSQLNAIFAAQDLEGAFKAYAAGAGIELPTDQWNECKEIILPQAKALIGRNTPLEDEAFYSYVAQVDNAFQAAVAQLRATRTSAPL